MTQLVECPACEVEFPIAQLSSAECICPFCRFRFIPTVALVREHLVEPSPLLHSDALPVPRKVAALRVRTEIASPDENVLAIESVGEVVGQVQTTSIPWPLEKSPARPKKHRAEIWLFGISLSALAILGLVFLVTFLNQPKAATIAQSPPTVAPTPQLIVEPTKAVPMAEPTILPTTKTESAVQDDPEQDWEFLRAAGREEYYSLWTKIHPHLVRLQVQTTGGPRTVGGVIVDSRGYVATSFRAIREAVSIEVRPSSKALVAGDALGELSDNVRGLIASDEDHDLAILQINRRFVSTFANVSIVGPNSALPGDRCIVAAPPTDSHRIWLVDFPIRHVQPFGQLLAQFQTALIECKLDSDTQANCIVGAIPANRFVPGSPIFSLKGELVGLLTAASVESHGIAYPAANIPELLKTNEGTVKPFPIDQEIVSEVSSTADVAILMPPSDSSAFPTAESLSQALQSIAKNDFFPENSEQYLSFRRLADGIFEIEESLQGNEFTNDQRQELRTFLEGVLDRFQKQLEVAKEANPAKVEDFNRLAKESAADDRGFVAFGEVLTSEQNAIDGSPYVIFRLPGANEFLYTSIRHDGPIFLPGSRWLLIGRHLRKNAFRTTHGVTAIDAQICDIRYVFSLDPTDTE